MEKQKQRMSVPKLKEASESKRLHSRLNTLQIPRDQPEDVGDDENSNVGPLSVYTRSHPPSYSELKTTLLSSIENRMDQKEELSKEQPGDIH